MKKFNIFFGIIGVLSILSSCGEPPSITEQPNAKDKNTPLIKEEAEASTVLIPDTYEKTEGNVQFKAKVICPDHIADGKLELPNIHLQTLDEEKIVKELFQNIAITGQEAYEYLDEDGTTSTENCYTGEQEQFLSIQAYRAAYTTPFYRNYVVHAFDLERNADKYSTEQPLSFMEVDTAWKNVQDMFKSMNIDLGKDTFYRFYALEYQTLSEEEYVIDMDGNIAAEAYKPSWTEEDEGYYFCIWQTYDGIKIHCSNIDFIKEYADFNAPVQVLLTKNETSSISIGRTFIIEPESNTKQLCALDHAADTVIKKFSMLITDAEYVINHMELCYYPYETADGGYALSCAWILNVIEKQPSGEEANFQMAIDAISAEELY